jgi:hypothetical protein
MELPLIVRWNDRGCRMKAGFSKNGGESGKARNRRLPCFLAIIIICLKNPRNILLLADGAFCAETQNDRKERERPILSGRDNGIMSAGPGEQVESIALTD